MAEFKNRVFGCAIVKAVNANYNADFSGQPRTLPSGTVYATDKTFKYAVKNYLKDVYPDEKILGIKRYNPHKEFVPFSLVEAFCNLFPNLMEIVKKTPKKSKSKDNKEDSDGEETSETIKLKATKKEVAKSLLSCFDARTFGFTFAGKAESKSDNVSISVHGPVQVLYGVNLWEKAQKYTDQIMSPYRNPDEKSEDKQATSLGRQSRLDEGHYLHHFSINPQNLRELVKMAGDGCQTFSDEDIKKLKEAMRRGVTWYDSASKAGCENEILVWVQLKEKSKIVLPNFSSLISLKEEKEFGKCVYDFSRLKDILIKNAEEIDFIEVYYNNQTCKLENFLKEEDMQIQEAAPSASNSQDCTSKRKIKMLDL